MRDALAFPQKAIASVVEVVSKWFVKEKEFVMKTSGICQKRRYQVIILPAGDVVLERCTLGEADAYISTYEAIMREPKSRAVIALEPGGLKSRAGRSQLGMRACSRVTVSCS